MPELDVPGKLYRHLEKRGPSGLFLQKQFSHKDVVHRRRLKTGILPVELAETISHSMTLGV